MGEGFGVKVVSGLFCDWKGMDMGLSCPWKRGWFECFTDLESVQVLRVGCCKETEEHVVFLSTVF